MNYSSIPVCMFFRMKSMVTGVSVFLGTLVTRALTLMIVFQIPVKMVVPAG